MNLAKKKNRSIQGWGALGLVLPLISIFILSSLSKLYGVQKRESEILDETDFS